MIAYFTRHFSILCLLFCCVGLIYCCTTSKLFWDKYTNGNVIKTEYYPKYNYTTISYSGISENGIECKFEKDLSGRPENLSVCESIIANNGIFYEINGEMVGAFVAAVIVFVILFAISSSFFDVMTSEDIRKINKIKIYLWSKYKIFMGYPYEDVEDFCDLFYCDNKRWLISYSEIEKSYKKENGNLG